MNEQEFENKIKDTMRINTNPSRESFKHVLLSLKNIDVTKSESMRYNTQTTKSSNIINNNITNIIAIWRSKRIVLIPSFIALIIVGTFTLSPHYRKYDPVILRLADQNVSIDESTIDNEEEIFLTTYDTPDINDIGINENEN